VVPLLPGGVEVAAVNSPVSVVVSGVEEGVAEVVGVCAGRGWKTRRLGVSHAFHSALMEPMLEEFARALEGVRFGSPRIPVVSTVTGELLSEVDVRYWVGQVRRPVRFADAVAYVAEAGVRTFVEVGPDAALTSMVEQIVDDAVAVPAARRSQEGTYAVVTALAGLHANGIAVDWAAFFAGTGARLTDLPTYPFQRQRYWQMPDALGGDLAVMGLKGAGHPILGAVVAVPDTGAVVLTGQLSVTRHPWLADHDVLGTVTFAGSGLVEMALHAGRQVGCDALRELVAESPLPLSGDVPLAVRVVVGAASPSGERTVQIYSRADSRGEDDAPWRRHAGGVLASEPQFEPEVPAEWPPRGAEQIDVPGVHARLMEIGYGHGPTFQALNAVWRRGEDLFAEVSLPEDADRDGFVLHPAMLDAAVQLSRLGGGAELESAWRGVVAQATDSAVLRAHVAPHGDGGVSITLSEPDGRHVISIGSVESRTVSAGELASAAGTRPVSLLRLEWVPAPGAAEAGAMLTDFTWSSHETALSGKAVPDFAVAPAPAALGETLALLKDWIADERSATSKLVVVTRNGVAADGGEPVDPGRAPVWGLVRAAMSEYPDRFVLVDLDEAGDADRELPAALATGETEVAVRAGEVLVPRLAKAEPAADVPVPWTTPGTVLVTGGTTGAGALVARHLVAVHGVRRLLLTGPPNPGLEAELSGRGAEVSAADCDISDRAVLDALVAAVPESHPLVAVVHAADATDGDGPIGAMTGERLDAVFGSAAEAAWNLHELTRDRDLAAFVMISSSAGLMHGAGRVARAAASAHLDALAAHRRSLGLPARSFAFGPWETAPEQEGVVPLTAEEGLDLFDAAFGVPDTLLVLIGLDRAVLRTRPDELPAPLRVLIRVPSQAGPRNDGGRALRRRLEELTEPERERVLLDLVRTHAATVLGSPSIAAVEPDRPFQELGFDSLAAVRLRRLLNTATGLRLPATFVFDHPAARAAAAFLAAELQPASADAVQPVLAEIEQLGASLSGFGPGERAVIAARLEAVLRDWRDADTSPRAAGEPGDDFATASDEELFQALDSELGAS
ncbi:SDR family NAD(P)-dependent oxidoreductase, partial [Streptomyces violaceusniger]